MADAPQATTGKTRVPVWVWVSAAVLLIAVAGVAFWLWTSGSDVAVPDVTGGDRYLATQALQAAGLELGEVTQEETSAPAGTVVAQDPAGGAEVAKGSVVAITVSAGPKTVSVPDLVGLTHSEALKLLEGAGLVSTETAEYDSLVADGSVIDQLPASGEKVAPGSTVGLLVSLGSRPLSQVKVPDVSGKTQGDATSVLREVGLVGYVVSANDDQVPAGAVIEQAPAGGEKVSPGSVILVLVSAGTAASTGVEVPGVVGTQQDAARSALEKVGLKGQAVQIYDTRPVGEVIEQEPRARVRVTPGSTIGLLVSAGPAPTKPPAEPPTYPDPPTEDAEVPEYPGVETVEVPYLLGMTEAEATAAVLEVALQPIPVPYPTDQYEPGIVVKQLPEAKETVLTGYSVMFLVSAGSPDSGPDDGPDSDSDSSEEPTSP